MSFGTEAPIKVHSEFELIGRPVGMGEVLISSQMAECVHDFVAQEFLPSIDSTKVIELDYDHDLSEGRKGYSYPGKDDRIHRFFAGVALDHGMDTWTLGVLTTDMLTGQVQHRKMKLYRFVVSSGQVLEAFVQKKFIIDMADLDVESVIKHDNSILRRKAVEKPLEEDDCWHLIDQLDLIKRQTKPNLYLGIPVNLYP